MKTLKQALRLLTRSNRRTSEQIVAYLKRAGFTNERSRKLQVQDYDRKMRCQSCPIALFLKHHTGKWCLVGGLTVKVDGGRHDSLHLPDEVIGAIDILDDE